ncbi:MAG: hypothetical protein ACYTDY_10640 [Planctomycetota bacterium]|jgi:hypothetical protein
MTMNRLITAGLVILAIQTATLAKEDGCLTCHLDEDMEERGRRPALLFAEDAHGKAGLSCADCHGGLRDTNDFMKAHSRKRAGFRGKADSLDATAICAECHESRERMERFGPLRLPIDQAGSFKKSVHGRIAGVEGFERPSCSSCHGSHGVLPSTDPKSAVHPTRVPATCARCHQDLRYMRAFTSARVRVDQLIEYRTSVHGEKLEKGDVRVAVCSSCHESHDILPAGDPSSSTHPLRVAETCGRCHSDPDYMKGYTLPDGRPLPTDQLESYRGSVHHLAMTEKGDHSAPTCNDCHGNHGATPPEVRTVATVCAQCHSRPAELFGPSELKKELDAQGFRECSTCHGHHGVAHPDDSLLAEIASGGIPSSWKPGESWRRTAATYLEGIEGLENEIRLVDEKVSRVEGYGMDLTRARLKLSQARDRLIQARVVIHSFDLGALQEVIQGTEDEEGGLPLVRAADGLAEEAMEERTFRRVGLAVALAIIAGLILALTLKIRRMESAGV